MASEDERLARQLQAEEYQHAQEQPDAPPDILLEQQADFNPVQLSQPYPPAYPSVNIESYPPAMAGSPLQAASPSYVPSASYPPIAPSQQAIPQTTSIIDQNSPAIEGALKDPKTNLVLSQARLIRLLAAIEVLTCILLIISRLFFLIFLIVMPVLGYFAGRQLSGPLSVVFLVYLVAVLIVRIIVTAVVDVVYFTVIQSICMPIDILFMWYVVRFIRLLRTVSPDQQATLLLLQNGPPSSFQCFE